MTKPRRRNFLRWFESLESRRLLAVQPFSTQTSLSLTSDSLSVTLTAHVTSSDPTAPAVSGKVAFFDTFPSAESPGSLRDTTLLDPATGDFKNAKLLGVSDLNSGGDATLQFNTESTKGPYEAVYLGAQADVLTSSNSSEVFSYNQYSLPLDAVIGISDGPKAIVAGQVPYFRLDPSTPQDLSQTSKYTTKAFDLSMIPGSSDGLLSLSPGTVVEGDRTILINPDNLIISITGSEMRFLTALPAGGTLTTIPSWAAAIDLAPDATKQYYLQPGYPLSVQISQEGTNYEISKFSMSSSIDANLAFDTSQSQLVGEAPTTSSLELMTSQSDSATGSKAGTFTNPPVVQLAVQDNRGGAYVPNLTSRGSYMTDQFSVGIQTIAPGNNHDSQNLGYAEASDLGVDVTSSHPEIPLQGYVEFFEGDIYLGYSEVNNGAVWDPTPGVLPVGHHTIRATYSGDSGLGVGPGETDFGVDITNTPTHVSLDSASVEVRQGNYLTIDGDVSTTVPDLDDPFSHGDITLSEGDHYLGALHGSKILANLSIGRHILTVQYSGGGSYLSSSADEIVDVLPPPTIASSLALSLPSSKSRKNYPFGLVISHSSKKAPPPSAMADIFIDGSLYESVPTDVLAEGITPSKGGKNTNLASLDLFGRLSTGRHKIYVQVRGSGIDLWKAAKSKTYTLVVSSRGLSLK